MMLEKIEDAYISIVRVCILSFSGILLVASFVFIISAALYLFQKPVFECKLDIDIDDSINISINFDESSIVNNKGDRKNDYMNSHNRWEDPSYVLVNTTIRLESFLDDLYCSVNGNADCNEENIANIYLNDVLKNNTINNNLFESYEVEFLQGFAKYIEILMKNDKIINFASSKKYQDIAMLIIDRYSNEFMSRFMPAIEKYNNDINTYRNNKARYYLDIYIAAGVFFSFILLTLLSIFMKIEKNLRGIAKSK
jgi:hypothetical protein